MNQWLTSELWQRRRSKPDELKEGALVPQCLSRVLGFLLVKRHQSSGFRWGGVNRAHYLVLSQEAATNRLVKVVAASGFFCAVSCVFGSDIVVGQENLRYVMIYNAFKFNSCFLDHAVVRF